MSLVWPHKFSLIKGYREWKTSSSVTFQTKHCNSVLNKSSSTMVVLFFLPDHLILFILFYQKLVILKRLTLVQSWGFLNLKISFFGCNIACAFSCMCSFDLIFVHIWV